MRRLLLAAAAILGGAVLMILVVSPTRHGLDYYLVTDDQKVVESRLARFEQIHQGLVAACMRAAGMRYEPNVPAAASPRGAADVAASDGFGVSTRIGQAPQQTIELDPNMAYLDTLNGTAADAYREALFGTGGCDRLAREWVIRQRRSVTDRSSLVVTEIQSVAAADPRMATALTTWQACVAAAGLPVEKPEELFTIAQSLFEARLNALDQGSPTLAQDLAELQQDERETAVAVVDCDAGHASTAAAARLDAERAVIRGSVEQLDQMRHDLLIIDERLETYEPTWPPEDLLS